MYNFKVNLPWGGSTLKQLNRPARIFLKISAAKRLQGELASSVVPLRGTTDEDSTDASPPGNRFKAKML
jgi:hypothetical protein